MSYILDALRRAEADRERERGRVPGLHTHPLSGTEAAPAAGPRRWLPWAGGGLLLIAGIGAGSWWASAPPEAAAPVPPPAPAPLATAAPPPATLPAPAAPAATVAPAAQTATAVPPPAASASPYLPPMPPPAAVGAAPAPRRGSVAGPAPAAQPAPAPEAPIPRLSDLPESMRREMPKLTISGSVYSDDPASRFVMINGEVAREGAKLGADLVLEQIGPRELVLRFKGQRYRQPI
jgi:general secretion pathway protein B